MILAGDIGGTKTVLGLFDWTNERVAPARTQTFVSADYQSLDEIVDEFLRPAPVPTPEGSVEGEPSGKAEEPSASPVAIHAACFGVAGPVIDNRCRTTNLPWIVDGPELGKRFALERVRLLNDLEATAYGLEVLSQDEVEVLNVGTTPPSKGAIALIAAGTGLGEAILYWDGTRYRPQASEGGHADFGPNSDLEIELLRHLRGAYPHVSYERVLSGAGLHAIYEFLRDTKKHEPTWLGERLRVGDPAPIIAEAGLKKQADITVQALDLFASIYGAEAGNLALKALALDAVYVGGGIAPKILEKLKDGAFMRAFTAKGRYHRMMSGIPVRVVMNPMTALLGAAVVAAQVRASTT